MKQTERISLYELLSEVLKHSTFNPQAEVLAELANKVMYNKIVTVSSSSSDPDEVFFNITEIDMKDGKVETIQ